MGAFTGFEHIVREQEPLAPYTWFRLGGPAQYFAEPTSIDELTGLVKRAAQELKFKGIFLEIYQTQSLFAKYFTYGNQKVTPSYSM